MIITATKYRLNPEQIEAGTRGSYGIEKLEFALSSEWEGRAILAVFYPARGKPIEVPYLGGEIDIPPEVMAYDGISEYVLSGTVTDGETLESRIITVRGFINVTNTLKPRGGNSNAVTPDTYDLFLGAATEILAGHSAAAAESASQAQTAYLAAEKAKEEAGTSMSEAKQAQSGAESARDAADTSAKNAADSERNASQSSESAAQSAERAEQAAVANGYMEFELSNEDGILYLVRTDNIVDDVDFELDENTGELEVIIK